MYMYMYMEHVRTCTCNGWVPGHMAMGQEYVHAHIRTCTYMGYSWPQAYGWVTAGHRPMEVITGDCII